MSYSLSFSQEFFTGSEQLEDIQPSARPENCLQAIISLPKREQVAIARDVLGSQHPVLYVTTESFPYDVLDKIRETDTCGDLCSPVEVYIDPEGYHSILVYDPLR